MDELTLHIFPQLNGADSHHAGFVSTCLDLLGRSRVDPHGDSQQAVQSDWELPLSP